MSSRDADRHLLSAKELFKVRVTIRCGVCPTTWLAEAPAGLVQLKAFATAAQPTV